MPPPKKTRKAAVVPPGSGVVSLPTSSNTFDGQPLFTDNEIVIVDENKLVEWTGYILLGYHSHIDYILHSNTSPPVPVLPKQSIARFVELFKKIETDKRDGWLFQIISWLALKGDHADILCKMQPPHDAPAQHGIDGLALLLDKNNMIKSVVITEDKCTENPRDQIRDRIWPEFKKFEEGDNDQKLVSRLSALLQSMPLQIQVLQSIQQDIYRLELRRYRVGVTRTSGHRDVVKRKALFKDYDQYVSGDLARRTAASFEQDDIRDWMEKFSAKIITFLESL